MQLVFKTEVDKFGRVYEESIYIVSWFSWGLCEVKYIVLLLEG